MTEKMLSSLPKDAYQDPLYPHVQYLVNNIKKHITNLTPKRRFKRSIDWLGSAWKWLAGSPDKQDMTIVEDHINNVLRNNNQQVIINQNFNNKINEVIRDFNKINKASKSSIEDAIFNLQHMEEDLKNIIFAIHWSKQDIINPQLLNQNEMELVLKNTDYNQLPYTILEETLNFASIKIAADAENVIYIVSLPVTNAKKFEVLAIRNNKRQNPAIALSFNTILYNNENIYGVKNQCKTIGRIQMCERKDLIDITNSECIPNIIKGKLATCNKIPKSSTTVIEELDDGILLLNNFKGKINGSCGQHDLNGTYILKYNNCSIELDDQWYITTEIKITAVPQIYQTNWKIRNNQYQPSLEEIHELHLNNTQIISAIDVHRYANSSSIIILILILITVYIIVRSKKRKVKFVEIKERKAMKENEQVQEGLNI